MTVDFHRRMLREFGDKAPLEAARSHAIAYLDAAIERRVYPAPAALAELANFAEPLPEEGMEGREVVDLLARYGAPATVSSIGGRYFGLVVGGVLPAALGARWLADAWNQNAALYRLSPIAAHLEEVSEQWLKALFGLPDETVAGFVSGSSVAILVGLAAARERVFRNKGWDFNTKGFRDAPAVRV